MLYFEKKIINLKYVNKEQKKIKVFFWRQSKHGHKSLLNFIDSDVLILHSICNTDILLVSCFLPKRKKSLFVEF